MTMYLPRHAQAWFVAMVAFIAIGCNQGTETGLPTASDGQSKDMAPSLSKDSKVDLAKDLLELQKIEKKIEEGTLPTPPLWTLIHMASDSEKQKAIEAFCSETPKDGKMGDLAEAIKKAGGLDKYRAQIAGLLKSPDPTVRGFAAIWLADLGGTAYKKDLLALLETESQTDDEDYNKNWDRGQAAYALGILGAHEYAENLAALLHHQDKYLRSGAIAGLAQLGAKKYEPAIAPLLQDDDQQVVCTAISALAKLHATQYRDQIAALTESPQADIAKAASAALLILDPQVRTKSQPPEESSSTQPSKEP